MKRRQRVRPKDVSTYAHMFGCWETLYIIKAAMEAADYQGPADRQKLIEATEAMSIIQAGPEHPQGAKVFNGKTHQVFGHQYISRVEDGKAGAGAYHVDRRYASIPTRWTTRRRASETGVLRRADARRDRWGTLSPTPPEVFSTEEGQELGVEFGPHLMLAILEGAVGARCCR